jgi:hypothetical protein
MSAAMLPSFRFQTIGWQLVKAGAAQAETPRSIGEPN